MLRPFGPSAAAAPHGRVPRTRAMDSQDVQAQHPPDQEEGDHGHDDVAKPLAHGLWLSAVFHTLTLAGGNLDYAHSLAFTACEAVTPIHLFWFIRC
jgi:hypothetical protein